MSLSTTVLATVSTGSRLYLYYQKEKAIHEAQSDDGVTWTESSTIVGDNAKQDGSPITAYHVSHDGGDFEGKSTVHVFYLDAANRLREKVKILSGEGDWKETSLPEEITKAPTEYSKLSSGVCHDKAPGAHQWVFFEKHDDATGTQLVAELRNGSESGWKWKYRKTLPEKAEAMLPGTSLASNLTDPTTHLFFQDHTGNVMQYNGGYEKWEDKTVILKAADVETSTPLAACSSSTPDKPHVFYVSKGAGPTILDYCDGKSTKVVSYYPGTKIGAALLGDKPVVFYRKNVPPFAISTMEYDGAAWKTGHKVVA